jgi:GWxTD domain-containing protein
MPRAGGAFVLLALGLVFAAVPGLLCAQEPPNTSQRALAESERLIEAGEWEEALEVLGEAADSLFFAGNPDPRLSFEYIELAASRGARGYYGRASELYLQGLTDVDLNLHGETVAREIEFISPILADSVSERWRGLAEARDREILREIRRYWVERDPTPTTRLNERLIEHWRRIAYSRENFRNGSTTVYGADDRAPVYVRFGPPDKKRGGSLGANEGELRRWVQGRAERDAIARHDPNPQYEIWVYDTLNPREFVYFLFGNDRGTGPFVQVDGVRDLISDAAMSPNSRRWTPGEIKVAHFLELFYYADLSAIGGPFGRRYQELEQLWGQAESRGLSTGGSGWAPPEGSLETFSYRYMQEDRYGDDHKPTVLEYSEVEETGRVVELVANQTRILTDANEPLVVITALSAARTRQEDVDRRLRARDTDLSGRGIQHALVVRDENLEEVGTLIGSGVHFGQDGISAFTLRYGPRPVHLTVVAELVSGADQEGEGDRPLFPAKQAFNQLPPLSRDTATLELSDLVVGIEPPGTIDSSLLPFPVVPALHIWRGDPVRVYLETYHTALVDGMGSLGVGFEITGWDTERDAPLQGGEPVALEFELKPEESTSRNVYDLGLQNLPAGRYRLRATVTDRVRGDGKTRDGWFTISSQMTAVAGRRDGP